MTTNIEQSALNDAYREWRDSADTAALPAYWEAFEAGALWQFTRPEPPVTDAEVEAVADELERHEIWRYTDDGRVACECGTVLDDPDGYATVVLVMHRARAALEAARTTREEADR